MHCVNHIECMVLKGEKINILFWLPDITPNSTKLTKIYWVPVIHRSQLVV